MADAKGRYAVTPEISIVIINKSDPGVADTLEALDGLSEVQEGTAEVVVVDASQGRFDELRRRFPRMTWIVFEPIAGRSSIPHQRNRGIAAAQGSVIAFTDASCVPDPGWLERLAAPIRSGEETIVAGAHRSPDKAGLRDEAATRRAGKRYLSEAPTINLAFKREVLEQIGGFDESFRYGSDVDVAWRAIDAGHRIRFVPEAVVSHDFGSAREEARRSFAYGRARAHLYLKHPHRWRGLVAGDAPVLVYPLVLLVAPVFVRRPVLLGVFAIPLARNRGRRPLLTLADHLIYGMGVLTAVGQRMRAGPPRVSA